METPCFLINAFHGLSQHIVNRNFASTMLYFFGVISGRWRTCVRNWLICCWAVKDLLWPFCLEMKTREAPSSSISGKAARGMLQLARGAGRAQTVSCSIFAIFPLKKEHLLVLWVVGLWVTTKLTEPTFWLWSSRGHSPVSWKEKKKKHSKLLSILQTLASHIPPPHAIRVILANLRMGQGMLFWVLPPLSPTPTPHQPCFPSVLHSPCTPDTLI